MSGHYCHNLDHAACLAEAALLVRVAMIIMKGSPKPL